MFVMGNLIFACAKIVDILLTMMYWLILIRALVSWVSPDPFNPIIQFLYRMTEPVLMPIRRILPRTAIDISPIVAFFAIIFMRAFLVMSLYDLAARLR